MLLIKTIIVVEIVATLAVFYIALFRFLRRMVRYWYQKEMKADVWNRFYYEIFWKYGEKREEDVNCKNKV